MKQCIYPKNRIQTKPTAECQMLYDKLRKIFLEEKTLSDTLKERSKLKAKNINVKIGQDIDFLAN